MTDEFDELRDAWEEFTAPFWDLVRRVKDKLNQILERVVSQ